MRIYLFFFRLLSHIQPFFICYYHRRATPVVIIVCVARCHLFSNNDDGLASFEMDLWCVLRSNSENKKDLCLSGFPIAHLPTIVRYVSLHSINTYLIM